MTAPVLPVTLTGCNLRKRHREFNSIVNETFPNSSFEELEQLPERSSIDRMIKIDLASKHRNVEYILHNLKDDNMLYVSRSLKCLWLLEPQYKNIINPEFLESSLYPDMIQPAVHKMKRWLQLNLRETGRCEGFYVYYKMDFDAAVKFFWHCSNQFILSEFPSIIHNFSFTQLNVLLEICPQVGRLYLEMLPNNSAALSRYVKNEYSYFSCFKHILKWDGELFLDVVEKYFNISNFRPFGPSLTNRIMKKYKYRVIVKCELYVSSVLHINSLAMHLTAEEAKEVVLRLAQAEYLRHWFSYQTVEPLIKRLKVEDRSGFKKQIFSDKMFKMIEEWPYPLPSPLRLEEEKDNSIFDDISDKPYKYDLSDRRNICLKRIKKKKCCYGARIESCNSGKSPLDRLFNRYRVIGFERTFYELSKNLKAESAKEGRLNMMLVLVSKSGGVPVHVEKLMKLLVEGYKNEPTTVRAAVVRSLVKRCSAWRLPEDTWSLILEFGRDVGLDGANSTPLCREGLHAVIIRHLLADTPISPAVLTGFMREFSTLSEYKLNAEESKTIGQRLPLLVLSTNTSAFLDCLSEYKKDIKDFPEAREVILEAAMEDVILLRRIYKLKIFRRELFRETFSLRQSDEDYLNVLRHDVSPLENGNKFASSLTKKRPRRDRFLRSLNLYFGESDGLAEKHRKALEEAFAQNPQAWFAGPLCTLMTDQSLLSHLATLDSQERPLNLGQLQSLRAFRANAHKSSPSLDIDSVDWKWIGAKAVSNKVLICRTKTRDRYIEKLLQWKRTARISLRLSINTPVAVDNFLAVCSLRPTAALKVAVSVYFANNTIDPNIWNAVKLLIESDHFTAKNKRLQDKWLKIEIVPVNIEADYWMCIYKVVSEMEKFKAMPVLCRLANMFHKVEPNFFSGIIKEYIQEKFTPFEEDGKNIRVRRLYVQIIAKYLLRHPEAASEQGFCNSFFDGLTEMEDKTNALDFVKDFIFALKYSRAFLDQEYSSLMKVFEEILQCLHVLFPLEKHFGAYVDIHITMLYLKTIKQVMKKNKEVLDDSKETIEFVGRLLGKYIGCEIKELVSRYFWTIIDLYKRRLEQYLRSYFKLNRGRSCLVTSIIKGILEVGSAESLVLVEHITHAERHDIAEPHKEAIMNVLKESQNPEVKFFYYADVLC